MIEVRHLRAFLAVARHAHFTRAAAALHLAQPALSQQIAQLEDHLGTRLFERSRRGARLTDAGTAFRGRAERVLSELDSAHAEAQDYRGLARGRVVLGTIASLAATWLPSVLGRFRDRYPGIEIVLREEHTRTLVGWLAEGAVDLALVHTGSLRSRGRSRAQPIAHAGLAFAVLEEEEMVLVMPRGHRLAGGSKSRVRFADLAGEPFVLYKDGSLAREMMLAGAAAAGFTPRSALEATGNDTVRAFVAAGFGVSLLPRTLAVTAGPPVAVASLSPPAKRVVSLGRRKHGAMQPAVQALHAFLGEHLPRAT